MNKIKVCNTEATYDIGKNLFTCEDKIVESLLNLYTLQDFELTDYLKEGGVFKIIVDKLKKHLQVEVLEVDKIDVPTNLIV